MNLDFIEVGTSDFDSLLQSSKENAKGISIEPLQEYLDRLPSKKNIFKVCKGISDKRIPSAIIYYIPPRIIEHLKLPDWLKGCNSFFKKHLQHKIYEEYVACDCVEIVRFVDIVNEFKVSSVKLLKLDCEGHDLVILKSIYNEYIEGLLDVLPEEILFECYVGDKKEPPYCRDEDLNEVIMKFKSLNYALEKKNHSNYALKKSL
tara:strand:+ start:3840 stop:4451 length:612 start_codon:yes stop_codon:yes gene_type:complete